MGNPIMLTIEHGKSGNVITKQNDLIASAYKLTLQEQRLLLVMISMINKEDKDFQPYIIDLKEFSKIVGYKGKSFYNEAQKITKKLLTRVIVINDNEKSGPLQINWISSAKYHKGQSSVRISFDPQLKPYLLQLKGAYTQFTLFNIMRLRSVYAIRIYELLKQYEGFKKERKFLLESLRNILGIGEQEYKLFGDFKRKVLEKAKKEINKKTDLLIDYETVKIGRKVEAVIFSINPNVKKEEVPGAEEISNKKLYNRLVNKFGISQKIAKVYLKQYTEKYIETNLNGIEYEIKRGKEIDNIGGFTSKALTDNYYDKQKSLFDLNIKNDIVNEKEKLEEEKKKAKKEEEREQIREEKLEEKYADYRKQIIEEYQEKISKAELQKITEEKKEEMIEEYGKSNIALKRITEVSVDNELFKQASGMIFEDWKTGEIYK